MRRDSPDRLTEGITAPYFHTSKCCDRSHQGSMGRSYYSHSVTITSLNSIKGQWCAADSVLSVQQVHLVVTRPSPLTITRHRAPLVHNSGTVHLTPPHIFMLVITEVEWVPPYTPSPHCSVTPNTSPAPATAAPIITIHLTLDAGPGQAPSRQPSGDRFCCQGAGPGTRADQWPM